MEMDAFMNVETLALNVMKGLAGCACPDIEDVFENTTKAVVKILGAQLCTIRVLNESGRLQLKSAYGLLKDMVYAGEIGLDEDCIGLTIKKQEVLVYKELENLRITPVNSAILSVGSSRSIAFLPIILNNKPSGVLVVCHSEELSGEDMELLTSMRGMVVSVLEKDALKQEIKKLYLNVIKTLVKTIEAKDIYTKGHSVRVSRYASAIARKLGFSDHEVEEAEVTGILHDIGKIGVNDIILTKPEGLNETEFQVIKQHPFLGSRILEPIGFSENIINGTLLHHKRFDLKGYPNDVTLKELPVMPRIIGAADAFDAMTSIRPYKRPVEKQAAIAEMKKHVGTQFCPQVVDAMEQLYMENLL